MKSAGVSEISSSLTLATPLCGRKASFSIHVYCSNIEQTSPDLLAAAFFCCLEALKVCHALVFVPSAVCDVTSESCLILKAASHLSAAYIETASFQKNYYYINQFYNGYFLK